MRKIISLFVLGTVLLACASSYLSKEEKERLKLEIATQIETRSFRVDTEQITPMGGRTIHLSSIYTLELDGDTARAFLPFFGRAYYASYGGSGGIKFEEKIEQYEAAMNKKGDGWDVRFRVNTREGYNYNFFLNIYDNGSVSFNVNSPQRSPVSFMGRIGQLSVSDE